MNKEKKQPIKTEFEIDMIKTIDEYCHAKKISVKTLFRKAVGSYNVGAVDDFMNLYDKRSISMRSGGVLLEYMENNPPKTDGDM